MTGKRPGPTKARNSPIAEAVAVAVVEMQMALMRAGGLSVYRIALALKVRRQSVDHILRRPHVAAMVEDFRERLRADQILRDWARGALVDRLAPAAGCLGALDHARTLSECRRPRRIRTFGRGRLPAASLRSVRRPARAPEAGSLFGSVPRGTESTAAKGCPKGLG
jgi:hypothetical protein